MILHLCYSEVFFFNMIELLNLTVASESPKAPTTVQNAIIYESQKSVDHFV